MRVFVTGASGWIGSAAVDELMAAGHEVTGLARSDASAAALAVKGVAVLRGDLDDLDSLRAGATARRRGPPPGQQARLVEPRRVQRRRALRRADHRRRAGRVTTGRSCWRPASRASPPVAPRARTTRRRSTAPRRPRGGAENLALEFVDRGVRTVSLRFAPTVHGMGDHGFIAAIAQIAREKGISGYPGEGTNRWAAVHRSDAARLVVARPGPGARREPAARGRGGGDPHPRDRRGHRRGAAAAGRPR